MINRTEMTVIENLKKRNLDNMNGPAFEGLGSSIDYKTFFDAVDIFAKAYLEMVSNQETL